MTIQNNSDRVETMKTILTKWQVWTYDVWGNKKDGYDVNDRYKRGEIELRLKVNKHNIGTPQEFECAHPTNYQLKKVFGAGCQIETDGDDLTVYVSRRSDGYPIGELNCLSHNSLSPIRS